MTRLRRTALAAVLVAASLTASSPAHAGGLSGLFAFMAGWFEPVPASSGGGLYFHPLPKPVR